MMVFISKEELHVSAYSGHLQLQLINKFFSYFRTRNLTPTFIYVGLCSLFWFTFLQSTYFSASSVTSKFIFFMY